MKKLKMESKTIITIMAIFAIFIISVISANNQILSPVNSSLGEKTIGWGIKRAKNNMQPDVGASNKTLLEENGGICLGKDVEKVIYLTFDEGYEAGYTDKILNTLKENDVKATFFITSHYLNTASDLVERMIKDGHEVGNHTPKYLMSGKIV